MAKELMLGIDVGASGIKGALVNITKGKLVGERFRVATPKPATPDAVAKAFAEVVAHFNWEGPVGCGFPAIVKNGVALSAANIDKSWIGVNAEELLSEHCGCPVFVNNDADVAGIAEMEYGRGKGIKGTTLLITIGSGLGSALFHEGELIPNTEFGHFFLKGHDQVAERYAADSIRKKEELSWDVWGSRFNEYLTMLERLFSPDLFILGGGSSKKFDLFSDQITIKTPVKPAKLLNHAGIIGASVLANKKKPLNVTSETF